MVREPFESVDPTILFGSGIDRTGSSDETKVQTYKDVVSLLKFWIRRF